MEQNTQNSLVLSVDLGTSGCKTALVSLEGQILSFEFAPVELLLLPGEGVEQRPEDWWRAFLQTTAALLEKHPDAKDRLIAVCCSTQGECTVCVDEKGQALSNAILWLDMRGAPHIMKQAGGMIAGYSGTKLLRYIRRTGGAPALSGKDPAGHMLFVRNEFHDLYKKTHRFLSALDYMNMRLTGRMVATSDSILTSWVTDNRNPGSIRYDDGLIRMSGIDREKLPELVRCSDVIGSLLPELANALGLPSLPVVAGAIDNTAAALGSGCVHFGEAHLYIGTSSWIAAHVPKKKTDLISAIAAVPCALPDRYLMTAMQSSAGANLTYLKDRILYHEDELLREEHTPDVYKIFDRIAARTPAGSGGLIYLPWLFGERCPVEDRTLRGGLFHLSPEHSREHIIRAFLEGVALNTRWMMKPIEKFLGKKLDHITITGGGATSEIWCSIFADTLGITVKQLDQPMQANALGAAYIAGLGLKQLSVDDIPKRTRIRAVFEPDAERKATMNRSFTTFLELHRRLRPLYHRLAGGKQ